MSNLLESFPTLTDNLIEKSGFKINEIKIGYIKNSTTRKLELTPIEKDQYFLDDEYGTWTPLENNLNINIDCTIQDKNVLFNEEYGVSNKNSVSKSHFFLYISSLFIYIILKLSFFVLIYNSL